VETLATLDTVATDTMAATHTTVDTASAAPITTTTITTTITVDTTRRFGDIHMGGLSNQFIHLRIWSQSRENRGRFVDANSDT
jgi:hypothetical protein